MSSNLLGERAEAFLLEAKPLLAALGGLNPATLSRLRVIAHRHGLDAVAMAKLLKGTKDPSVLVKARKKKPLEKFVQKDEAPSAGKDTQAQPPKKPVPPQPLALKKPRGKRELFPRHVARTIRKAGALWPPVYERLLHDAEKAGIDSWKAVRQIEWVATKLNKSFIPASEGEERLLVKAREMFAISKPSQENYLQLKAMSKELGVPKITMKLLVREAARKAKKKRVVAPSRPVVALTPVREVSQPERKREVNHWPTVFISMAGLILVGVSWYGFMRFPHSGIENKTAREIEPEAQAVAPAKVQEPKVVIKPAWVQWGSPKLAQVLEETEKAQPEAPRSLLQDCGNADTALRKSAYVRLAQKQQAWADKLLGICFSDEPNRQNAEAILQGILPIPAFDNAVPLGPDAVKEWFSSSGRLAYLVQESAGNPARLQMGATALEQRLGIKVEGMKNPDDLFAECQKQTMLKVYGHIANYAKTTANRALYLCEKMRDQADKCLGQSGRFVEETTVAEALFVAAQPAPTASLAGQAREFFTQLAGAGNLERGRLVLLYEKGDKYVFFQALEDSLLAASSLPREADGSLMAKAFRTYFGTTQRARGPEERVAKVREVAQLAQGSLTSSPDNIKGQLGEILRLAQASSLACALVGQGKPQADRFDEMLGQSTQNDKAKAGMANQTVDANSALVWTNPFAGMQSIPGVNVAVPISSGNEGRMVKLMSSASPRDRATGFASLCQHVNPEQVPHEIAEGIARYLMRSQMHQDELILIQFNLPRIANSAALKFALSEKIMNAPKTCPGAYIALGEITGKVPEQGATWKSNARRSLLESLLENGSDKTSNLLANAGDRYVAILKDQGRLVGIAEAEYLLRSSPSAILDANTRHLATRISKEKLSGENLQFVNNVPYFTATYSFQKLNDLQATTLQQRVFLRVLALYVAQEKPLKRTEALRVLEGLGTSDAQSDNVLVRLRGGESAILRAWLLLMEGQ